MANSPGQNATVEEILASIRQAISEDDAKRTGERSRTGPRAQTEKGPVANVSSVYGKATADAVEPEAEPEAVIEEADEVPGPDHDVIEQAIEQALNGVRAELEGLRPPSRVAPSRPRQAEAPAPAAQQRAIPRARVAPIRRETPAPSPRRALLSPRAENQVTASFDDLAKAMIEGNSKKLDAVVEDLLRPMLKQWLEGNLPLMVERLVREEIDRVSRGRR